MFKVLVVIDYKNPPVVKALLSFFTFLLVHLCEKHLYPERNALIVTFSSWLLSSPKMRVLVVIWGYLQLPGALSKPKPKKAKKNSTLKITFLFQEMELSSSSIKKILSFPKMKQCTFRPQPSKVSLKKISYIFS